MDQLISSVELNGRVIKLLTKSGKYFVNDSGDDSINNIIFMKQIEALEFYRERMFMLTGKEIN